MGNIRDVLYESVGGVKAETLLVTASLAWLEGWEDGSKMSYQRQSHTKWYSEEYLEVTTVMAKKRMRTSMSNKRV